MIKKDTLTNAEREQKIALCAQTYFNLYGRLPGIKELCKFLGTDYFGDIVLFLNHQTQLRAA